MKSILPLLALTSSLPLTLAWLPGVEKEIYSSTGTNIFNASATSNSPSKRWLPASNKIRGVNLGSHFVVEPWMASNAWNTMGCGGQKSEFDCVMALGQDTADQVFADHWGSWITQDDIAQMVSYGLNTVRIPVGYWLKEDLVYADSEHFPRGGMKYLEDVCGWASDAGMYIIIDLHGAPGAQEAEQPFTGQYAPTPGFYQDYQYDRALEFLEWMTTNIHQNNKLRNVGMIEIVNEPVQDAGQASSMINSYYPNGFTRIRNTESSLGITSNNYLHIQMMNEKWGSGDPTSALSDNYFAAYDDHRYVIYDSSVAVTKDSYIAASCADNRGGNWPTIVGEWSLSVPDDVEHTADWEPSSNVDFYKRWFAAQAIAYERQEGWVFWAWKAELGDYRWSYKDAVDAGVIPTDLDSIYDNSPC
ncbi:glycoside hydrolase family 5 protein [Aspergillus mulundensis]|uniref:glucan endo-1,6-beta-glucosidase n=1 Tax=Aspergillus mulundensis TaxID=1810919 RepID=A0A3D8T5W3_9EURO|nr:Glucan endo-1,6-beta-glucosidase B [Aspergillus mulundensis]RDW93956.1 Glucan endo-1,6-beta-glucosidase B [Aspergillus mulundensis]